LHEALAWTLLALVAVHIAAVLLMSVIQKENLVRAMVTGKRPSDRHPGAQNAKRPGLFSWLAGAIVIVTTIYAVIQYDPMAFSPRSTESAERHSNQAASDAAEQGED
jgi:hypothetical protein